MGMSRFPGDSFKLMRDADLEILGVTQHVADTSSLLEYDSFRMPAHYFCLRASQK